MEQNNDIKEEKEEVMPQEIEVNSDDIAKQEDDPAAPAFVKGAEVELTKFSVIDENITVTEGNFNTPLFMSVKKDIAKQIVTKYEDITGLDDDSLLQKKLQAYFASAGSKSAVVFGKDTTTSSGTPTTFKDALGEMDTQEYFYVLTDEIDLDKIKADSSEVIALKKQYVATPDVSKSVAELETTFGNETGDYTIIASKNDQVADARVIGFASPLVIGNYVFDTNVVDGGLDGGFTGAEFSTLRTANIGFMARAKGNIITQNIVNLAGKDLDYSVALKYMEDRLTVDLDQMLIASPKFSFREDRGVVISTVKTRMESLADDGVVIREDTNITLKSLDNIPQNEILAGIIKGLKVEFVYNNGAKGIEGTLFSK